MLENDGIRLVEEFIRKMEIIQTKHFSSLATSIQEELKSLKFRMSIRSISVKEKSRLVAKFRYLENMTKLKIIGFNSSKYDLPCLISYFLETMDPENLQGIFL